MVKVVALNTYEKRHVKDKDLNMIVPEGHVFEVSEERARVLLGDNTHKVAFVKLASDNDVQIEDTDEPVVEHKKRGRKPKK